MSAAYLLKALDNQNFPQALSILSAESFFFSLNPDNLILIKSRVLSLDALKYPIQLRLLTLAVIIINNTKLEPKEQKMCVEYLSETLKTSTYKEICAGLLVRLPNFQNKHTVLAHLHPSAIPLNLMVDIAADIKKNKPSALERQLLKHRQEWVVLLNGFELSFQGLKDVMEEHKELKEGSEFQLMRKIESEVSFLALRIRSMYNQKINLDEFCQTMEALIEAESNQKVSEFSTPITQLLQSSGYRLINEMLLKLDKRFIRKYQWLVRIIDFGVKTLSYFTDLTIQILTLINTIQKIFGNGALDTESILFTSKDAIITLLENLLVQSDDNKLFSMQAPSLNHHKLKNVSQLSLKKTHDPYPDFVKQVSKRHRQELLTTIFSIIILYFKEPHQSTHIPKVSDIMDQNHHKLSFQNKKQYQQIKQLMFPKAIVYSPGLEQVYEEIIIGGALDSLTKKRRLDNSSYQQPFNYEGRDRMVESRGMKLISSVSAPQGLNETKYYDIPDGTMRESYKHSMNESFHSFKNESEIFYTCQEIKGHMGESLHSIPDHESKEVDPLENALPLEPSHSMSKYSLIKDSSYKRSDDAEVIMEVDEGRPSNPIEIFQEESEVEF